MREIGTRIIYMRRAPNLFIEELDVEIEMKNHLNAQFLYENASMEIKGESLTIVIICSMKVVWRNG